MNDQSFYQMFPNFAPQGYKPGGQQPQKKKKNFWTDQISTATGILGGIGGSFVAPIAGTAAGAAAGSALGEAIEKMMAPGTTDWGDVAQEGVLGGVLGAGPIKLLKGGVAGGRALATGGNVVSQASKAAQTPLRQTIGKNIAGSADDLAIKQFRLNKTQLTNLNKTLGEDTGSFIRKYGFQNVDDVVTKGIDPLQKDFDTVVASLGKIPKSDVKRGLDKFITPLKNSVSLDDQRIAKQLQTQADELLKKSGNNMTGQDVLALRQLFDAGVKRSAFGSAELSVNKGMADSLRKTLQASADKAGLQSADGRSLKDIGLELNKLRTLHKTIEPQGQLGRGNLPLGLDGMLAAGVGTTAFGNPAGAVGGFVASKLLNSPTGRRAAMSGVDKIGNGLINAGAKVAGQPRKGIAKRMAAGGVLGGIYKQGQQEQPQSLEDALNQSLSNNMDTNSIDPMSMNPPTNASSMGELYPSEQQSSSPYSKENLMADIQRDPENAKQYLALYSSLSEAFTPEVDDKPSFGRPSAQLYSQATTGLNSIDQLEQMLAKDSSLATRNATPGQNLPGVGGLVSRAAGTNQYRAAANNILNSIARINTGAAMPASEEGFYNRAYLPQPGDTPQAIQAKIMNLRQFFAPIANYKAASSGGGNLEDYIMQTQGGSYY